MRVGRADDEAVGIQARTWLPIRRESSAEAHARGRISAEEAARHADFRLPVSDVTGPEMAVWAARRVLHDAGVAPADLGMVVHCWTHHPGSRFWSPAHFVTDQVGAAEAEPIGVATMCDGGARALGIGAARLMCDDSVDSVLVTGGDAFATPGFDRWRSDYGSVYGDAGTAVLLRRSPPGGGLLLRSVASASAPGLERTHRAADGLHQAPDGRPVDVRPTMRAFLEDRGAEAIHEVTRRCLERAVLRACSDTGVDTADERIRAVYLPRLDDRVLDRAYRPVLDALTKADVRRVSDPTGHLGTGDGAAAVEQISVDRALGIGQFALVLTGGAGFSWSCAVVEQG